MTFQKGDPKPLNSGRQKGAMNKRNALVHDRLTTIILSHLDHLQQYLDNMAARGYNDEVTKVLLRLTHLITPRPLPIDRYVEDNETARTDTQDPDLAT